MPQTASSPWGPEAQPSCINLSRIHGLTSIRGFNSIGVCNWAQALQVGSLKQHCGFAGCQGTPASGNKARKLGPVSGSSQVKCCWKKLSCV